MSQQIVFVIDDDASTVQLLTTILEDLDFYVLSFSSSLQAVDVSQEVRPDLVFSDLKMSDRDGLDVLSHFQALDEKIARILVTGHRVDHRVAAALLKGTVGVVLEKPFTIRGLTRAVAVAQSGRGSRIIKLGD